MIGRVDIDPRGGFCAGVIRAVGKAESYLSEHQGETLYSLGAIVHNGQELGRLSDLGLRAISQEQLPSLESGSTVIIRAHGEAPHVYDALVDRGMSIIDCTCPVVLGIQKKIALSSGDVIIFGKHGHPEVIGLLGNAKGRVWVVENLTQAQELVNENIDFLPEIDIYSQTTMSAKVYEQVCDFLGRHIPSLKVHNTICRQVSQRCEQIEDFARSHDVVVFVSGASSSNGRVLAGLAKDANPRTYVVENASYIDPLWFNEGDVVGVSGATSTPSWLLEEVANSIRKPVFL